MSDPQSYYSSSYVTSVFGPRPEYGGFHHGQDYAHPAGTSVPNIWSGTVIASGVDPNGQLGNMVTVESKGSNGQPIDITYGHLADKLNVKKGDSVSSGSTLGLVGDTSNASVLGEWDGPHTHVGVQVAGQYVDPNTIVNPLLGPASVLFRALGTGGPSVSEVLPIDRNLPLVGGAIGSSTDAVTGGASAVGGALSAVPNAATSVANTVNGFAKLITNSHLWWSGGFIAMGVLFVVVGGVMYLSSFKSVQQAESTAVKDAAIA